MLRAVIVTLVVALAVSPLCAQPDVEAQVDLDRIAAEQQVQARVDRLVEMGIDHEGALFLTLLSESGMDPSQIVLMMMMAEHGGNEMLPLMMMRQPQGQSAPPAVIDRGEELLIVEDGTLYVIDMTTMEIKSRLKYARPQRIEDSPIFSLLAPMIAGAREDAQQSACMSNLKQLGLAFMMYLQDREGLLPEENWVAEVMPYINNAKVFVCPSREHLPVGYALNEKIVGMDINALEASPQTVLAFESNVGGEAPVGGADDVPPEGVHNSGINVLYADGHVKWSPAEEAMDLLAMAVQ
jgi:prepilin-type processing-associated H-X9-DG protein